VDQSLAGTPTWQLTNSVAVGKEVYQVGTVDIPSQEISGTVLSRTRPDWFWAHNDGSHTLLLAFRADGTVISTWPITDFFPRDVEDIATDSAGRLYLADTGDNSQVRNRVQVVRLPEPGIDDLSVAIDRSWQLVWPDRPRDAETLLIHDNYGWLIAKTRQIGDRSLLARFPLAAQEDPITLEIVGEVRIDDPAAGADLTPDGKMLAVSTRKGAFGWRIDGDLKRITQVSPFFSLNSADTKKESAVFVPQGLLVIAETREMYLYTAATFRPSTFPSLTIVPSAGAAGLTLTWPATVGTACTIESRSNPLTREPWIAVAEVPGLGATTRWSTPVRPDTNQLFRIRTSLPSGARPAAIHASHQPPGR